MLSSLYVDFRLMFTEGIQCAVVDVTDTGFTMPEVIIMEGQGVMFEKGGRKTLEIVQVGFYEYHFESKN